MAAVEETTIRRRAGGRNARREKRQAETASPAVWPGITGGAYRPLSQRDMVRVHDTALDMLETIGMADPIPALVEAAAAKGCKVSSDGRLRFPRALVEDVVAGAAHRFPIYSVDGKHDIELGGSRVHFGVGGEAVSVLDFEDQRYRPSQLVDIYDAARLCDRLDHVHRFGNILVATDLPDWYEFAVNRTYACIAGTTKTLTLTIMVPAYIESIINMCDMVLGRGGAYLDKPFGMMGGCPIVSPLAYGADNSSVIAEAARLGITTMSVIASQAGATAPAALAGALAQNTAETLASLMLVNLIRPGSPMVFGNWPFVSDLRTGSFSGGGGEEAVLSAAAVQMAHFYDIPCSVGAGMTDSKLADAQAGYEKALSTGLAGMAGGDLVLESCGMMGSLMGVSFEAMVIDDEMLGTVQRAIRGIEVTDETLSFDVVRQAVEGPGHFLGSPQTLELMESEYLYPSLGDRAPAADWEEAGASDIRERARVRVRDILASHYPENIEPAADARIRENFPIRLAPDAMKPGNGRW